MPGITIANTVMLPSTLPTRYKTEQETMILHTLQTKQEVMIF